MIYQSGNTTNMTATPLSLYAGTEALSHIQKNGLQADDVAMLLGASSGPKWLVLHGIDQFLMDSFFKNRTKKLHLLGTSAGAWRMACYAMNNNAQALDRLTESYIEQRYSDKPSGQEILNTCRSIISTVLSEKGANEMVHHPYARMNLITTQCHGLTQSKSRAAKMLGYGLASLLNAASRSTLAWQFTRVVMHHPEGPFPSNPLTDLPTRFVPLTLKNTEDAILSTGAIPIIIQGVEDVAGKGIYQDGGITDYGFDLPLFPTDGFVLYPHFSKHPAPGWFDKSWFNKNKISRKPSHENYSKTIMLVPSDEFISRLPHGKIPDRHDFLNFSDAQRIKYWRETISLSKELYEDLSTLNWSERVQALTW